MTDTVEPFRRSDAGDRGSGTAARVDLPSRVLGCLLGGAVGDALGFPAEFIYSLAEIRERFGPDGVTDLVDGYHPAGSISDDTQMTLFTAEGLIRADNRLRDRGTADVAGVVTRSYLRWLRTQVKGADVPLDPEFPDEPSGWLISEPILHARRAPGRTCVSALAQGGARRSAPLNDSKGCGGVMRTAPVRLVAEDPFEVGCELAGITHGHPTGYLAAGAFALIISRLAEGEPLLEAAGRALLRLEAEGEDARETAAALRMALEAADETRSVDTIPDALGRGWIAEEALAISIYCALVAKDFGTGVRLAVNHGGDSDSTGALTGQLLGCLWGVQAVPGSWLDRLEGQAVIRTVAEDLAAQFGGFDSGRPVPDYERYPPW